MEQADRSTIKRNMVILSKDMDFIAVTSGLLGRDIFEKHHIERFDSKPSKREKNMALLMDIETRGPRAFTSLVETLIESNQRHLAQELGYPSSGPSQGQMGQARAMTAHKNRPALFAQPTQPWVRPARDGTGDYSSTPMDFSTSYPLTMVDSDLVYKMKSKPRGIAVIINNKKFNTPDLEERTGTDVDRDNLQDMFKQLGFKVIVHNDCTGRKIDEIIKEKSKDSHSSFDCFILAILSHGKEKDAIYGTDGYPVTLEYIMDQFGANRCPTLNGKPKLFFVQACRGEKSDEGVPVYETNGAEIFQGPAGDIYPLMDDENLAQMEEDSTDNSASSLNNKMPCQSDMLLSYSTVPGYVSWRDIERGTWFIQTLTEIILQDARKETLHSMLTKINAKVAKNFKSDCHKQYKQIPAFTSALTKDLKFFPEQYE